VLGLLPVDVNAKPVANGSHSVTFPDSGNFNVAPSTEGASLVVIYSAPDLPLRAILISDGAFTVDGSHPQFNLTMQGFGPTSSNAQSRLTHIVGDGQIGTTFSDRLLVNGAVVADPNNAFGGAQGALWDNLTVDTSALVPANSTQITTSVDNTPFIEPGFDCLTWGAVVFSTTIELAVEFITRGSADSLIPQEFTYNSVPCPVIEAQVDSFSMRGNSGVDLSISGRVTDRASDLVYDPNSQLSALSISVGGAVLSTVQLHNRASPQPPWRPYAFEAPFSVQLTFDAPDLGDFPVQLTTPVNVAGCPGALNLTLNKDHKDRNGVILAHDWEPDPGTYLPTLLRIRVPPGVTLPPLAKIDAFDRPWDIRQIDFGDGLYWYAVDPLQNAAVFLPAAYANSFIQTKKLDLEFTARIVNGAQEISKSKITVERGLVVDNNDVQGLLGNVSNFTKTQYVVRKNNNPTDLKNVFVYNTTPGKILGHSNNNLDTEILWRYIGTPGTVARFSSQAELQTDIDYREKVVAAARAWAIPFGDTKVNALFWYNLNTVRQDKTPTAALKDLFDSPKAYRFACLRSATYILLRAASQVSPNFDAIIGGEPRKNEANALRNSPRPDKANWLPGDWGYIKNTNPNNKDGFIAGENVIYLGGSFDLVEAGFLNTADFWGIIDSNGDNTRNIKKFQTWISTVAGWNTATGQSSVQPQRTHLKSPRLACPTTTGQVSVPYSSPIPVEGGEPPFTFSLFLGKLPNGLTLNSTTGVVSGTPTALGTGITAQGFTFSIRAKDASGAEEFAPVISCVITISK
jgi:hypothetical protein